VGHAAAAGGGLVRRRTEFVFSLKALRSAAQDVVTELARRIRTGG
jgi:hypothetical protein